jgi:ribosome biogenesis GTPase
LDLTKRQSMLAYVNTLESNERNKLYKRANELRKRHMAHSTKPRERRGGFDDEGDSVVTVRRTPPLEEFVLKILEQEEAEPAVEPGVTVRGSIIALSKGRADVWVDGETVDCVLAPDILKRQQTDIAVGDEVIVHRGETASTVRQVLPRRTTLSRPDPGTGIQRIIVANVDVVVIVVSVGTPPLHPRIVDRFLIGVERGGAKPVLAVNKLDLFEGPELEEEIAKIRPYENIGIPVVRCSAQEGSGIDQLRVLLHGKTGVFVGHSGVGKSSLLNALRPALKLKVGDVSDGYGRGRHTTTSSSLLDLGEGTRLIDTPGVRTFGLWKIRREELPWYFPEFETVQCRFRDCAHLNEPGCAVREAVSRGELSEVRYQTYLGLLEGVSE